MKGFSCDFGLPIDKKRTAQKAVLYRISIELYAHKLLPTAELITLSLDMSNFNHFLTQKPTIFDHITLF